jgi:hypothetical protein
MIKIREVQPVSCARRLGRGSILHGSHYSKEGRLCLARTFYSFGQNELTDLPTLNLAYGGICCSRLVSGRVSNGASDTPTYMPQNALQIDGLQVPCIDIQIIAPDEELQTDFMHEIRF